MKLYLSTSALVVVGVMADYGRDFRHEDGGCHRPDSGCPIRFSTPRPTPVPIPPSGCEDHHLRHCSSHQNHDDDRRQSSHDDHHQCGRSGLGHCIVSISGTPTPCSPTMVSTCSTPTPTPCTPTPKPTSTHINEPICIAPVPSSCKDPNVIVIDNNCGCDSISVSDHSKPHSVSSITVSASPTGSGRSSDGNNSNDGPGLPKASIAAIMAVFFTSILLL